MAVDTSDSANVFHRPGVRYAVQRTSDATCAAKEHRTSARSCMPAPDLARIPACGRAVVATLPVTVQFWLDAEACAGAAGAACVLTSSGLARGFDTSAVRPAVPHSIHHQSAPGARASRTGYTDACRRERHDRQLGAPNHVRRMRAARPLFDPQRARHPGSTPGSARHWAQDHVSAPTCTCSHPAGVNVQRSLFSVFFLPASISPLLPRLHLIFSRFRRRLARYESPIGRGRCAGSPKALLSQQKSTIRPIHARHPLKSPAVVALVCLRLAFH